MNDPNSAQTEPYTGQGSSKSKMWGKVVSNFIGQSSVSVKPNGFMPGSESAAQVITISEEGQLMMERESSLAVPPQAVWLRWVDARIRAWMAVRGSGLGVFHPTDEDFLFFECMADLIVMRYKWLRAVAADMQAGHDTHPWAVVWRYVVMMVQREFAGQPGMGTRLDNQLLEVQGQGAFDEERMLALLVPVDFYCVQRAVQAAEQAAAGAGQAAGGAGQAARGAGVGTGGTGRGGARGRGGQQAQQQLQLQAPPAPRVPPRATPAAPARARPPRPCPLCGSAEHRYHAGDYGHPVGVPITRPCNVSLSDGSECGRLHAWSGPLSSNDSPCRQVGEQ